MTLAQIPFVLSLYALIYVPSATSAFTLGGGGWLRRGEKEQMRVLVYFCVADFPYCFIDFFNYIPKKETALSKAYILFCTNAAVNVPVPQVGFTAAVKSFFHGPLTTYFTFGDAHICDRALNGTSDVHICILGTLLSCNTVCIAERSSYVPLSVSKYLFFSRLLFSIFTVFIITLYWISNTTVIKVTLIY